MGVPIAVSLPFLRCMLFVSIETLLPGLVESSLIGPPNSTVNVQIMNNSSTIESTAIDICEDDYKAELCNMCRDTPNCASQECLACKAYCCAACGREHTRQPRFAHHRLVPLNGNQLCPRHNQELILYCFECMRLCCLVCGHFSPEHFGHKLLDIDSAHEQLEPFLHELFSKLEDVRAALRAKEGAFVHQKEDLSRQLGTLKESMTATVRELTKAITTEMEHHIAQLDLLTADRLLRLDFELSKTQDLKSQIEKMTLPSIPKDRLLVFLPQAKNLIAVPIHPAEEFTLEAHQLDFCRDFLSRVENALQTIQRSVTPAEEEKSTSRQFGRTVSSNEVEKRGKSTRGKGKEEETFGDRSKRHRKKACVGGY